MHGSRIAIWFFISVLLVVYGGVILGYGIYEWASGKLSGRRAVDGIAHADLVGRTA